MPLLVPPLQAPTLGEPDAAELTTIFGSAGELPAELLATLDDQRPPPRPPSQWAPITPDLLADLLAGLRRL